MYMENGTGLMLAQISWPCNALDEELMTMFGGRNRPLVPNQWLGVSVFNCKGDMVFVEHRVGGIEG